MNTRLATREDAERFIRNHLVSAEWKNERLMIYFEKEALIHALVEQWTFPMEADGPPAQSTPAAAPMRDAVVDFTVKPHAFVLDKDHGTYRVCKCGISEGNKNWHV